MPHKWLVCFGLVGLLGGSAITLLFPKLIGLALDGEFGQLTRESITSIVLLLIGLFALQSGFFYVRHYAFWAIGYKIAAELRTKLFASILVQDVQFFDAARTGDLMSRLSSDSQVVQRAMTVNISVALRYFLQVFIGAILMLSISLRLSVVILALIPLVALAGLFWGRRLRALSRDMQDELGHAAVVSEESIGFVRTVKIFMATAGELKRYTTHINEALSKGLTRTRVAALFSSSMVFVVHSSIALVLFYGVILVQDGRLGVGALTAFILYCLIVAVSLAFLVGVWDEFMQAVGAAERIFEVLDSEPTVIDSLTPAVIETHTAGTIQFEHVSFSYPSRPDIDVLRGLSFQIDAGETVAMVGPSGAGKSTIAALILRHYDPIRGYVSYCGHDVRELRREDLLQHIGIVPQLPELFSVSIEENLRYGKPDATKEELDAAVQGARLEEFISSLPEGLQTLVGDRGIQLSGGQRQRVAIARAMLKNPEFLILDEATSSLDSENERLIREALETLMSGRTTLIIAHRLSTVQYADRVLVLKDGELCQEGTHQSLIGEVGLYKTLVEHQLL